MTIPFVWLALDAAAIVVILLIGGGAIAQALSSVERAWNDREFAFLKWAVFWGIVAFLAIFHVVFRTFTHLFQVGGQ